MADNPSDNVFELISSSYYDLTAAEKKIADFITANPEIVRDAGISDLADACGTADATISRFSRKLGYKGFNSMRIAIAQAISGKSDDAELLSGKIQMDDSFEDVCRKIRAADIGVINQTVDLIRPEVYFAAADLLEKAGKVLCMGQGGSVLIAMEAAHLFSTVSGKFNYIMDGHMQAIAASNMEKDDVILYFSYSGSVRDMMETLPLAKQRGAKVILVTRFPN